MRNLLAVWTVARKELVTSLRDRQTTLYTFVLPICLYPVLFWFLLQVVLVVQGRRERTQVALGLAQTTQAELPAALLQALEQQPAPEPAPDPVAPPIEVLEVRPSSQPLDADGSRAWLRAELTHEHEQQALQAPVDATLLLSHAAPDGGGALLFYDSTKSKSRLAEERTRQRLEALREDLRRERASALGFEAEALNPLDIEQHDLAPPEDRAALMLSIFFPMLLVVMTLFGAFFPAIDLTSGEKERGSAETTALVPTPRWVVHNGKILATTILACIAVTLNLAALTFSAEGLLSAIPEMRDFSLRIPFAAFAAITPLALLFAYFTSAVLVTVASFAPTYKAGQALMGPAQMVFILPAITGIMPGLTLSPGLAFVPILNVVLCFKAMLIAAPIWLEYGLTGLALFTYAGLATWISCRLAVHEEFLLAQSHIPLRRFFTLLRSSGPIR